jgi:hypothetical protein
MTVLTSLLESCCLILIISMLILPIHASNDRIVQQLQHMIHTALEDDRIDDNNGLLVEELSRILQDDEGFRMVNDRERRSMSDDDIDPTLNSYVDGSGDLADPDEHSPFYSNMSIIAFTMVKVLFLPFTRLILHRSENSSVH